MIKETISCTMRREAKLFVLKHMLKRRGLGQSLLKDSPANRNSRGGNVISNNGSVKIFIKPSGAEWSLTVDQDPRRKQ